jgi:hypothetical protein
MHISAGLTQTRADGGAVRALLYLDHENSAKTACDPAVFLIAEPLATQDFRGERDSAG